MAVTKDAKDMFMEEMQKYYGKPSEVGKNIKKAAKASGKEIVKNAKAFGKGAVKEYNDPVNQVSLGLLTAGVGTGVNALTKLPKIAKGVKAVAKGVKAVGKKIKNSSVVQDAQSLGRTIKSNLTSRKNAEIARERARQTSMKQLDSEMYSADRDLFNKRFGDPLKGTAPSKITSYTKMPKSPVYNRKTGRTTYEGSMDDPKFTNANPVTTYLTPQQKAFLKSMGKK